MNQWHNREGQLARDPKDIGIFAGLLRGHAHCETLIPKRPGQAAIHSQHLNEGNFAEVQGAK